MIDAETDGDFCIAVDVFDPMRSTVSAGKGMSVGTPENLLGACYPDITDVRTEDLVVAYYFVLLRAQPSNALMLFNLSLE